MEEVRSEMGYEGQERDGCERAWQRLAYQDSGIRGGWNGQKRSHFTDSEWQAKWFALSVVGAGRSCSRGTRGSGWCFRKDPSCWVKRGTGNP